jgi:hypothetical protein
MVTLREMIEDVMMFVLGLNEGCLMVRLRTQPECERHTDTLPTVNVTALT